MTFQFLPSQEQIGLIRSQCFPPELSDGEFLLFLETCKARGLNPLLRQVYAISRRSKDAKGNWTAKMTIQTAIEGFLLIANRTGEYRGSKTWTSGVSADLKGHAIVHRKQCEPFEVELDFTEFCQTNNDGKLTGMWAKMPKWMIQKVALARCLSRAFPEDLGGLYTSDEMPPVEQLVDVTPPAQIEERKAATKTKIAAARKEAQAQYPADKAERDFEPSHPAHLLPKRLDDDDVPDFAQVIPENPWLYKVPMDSKMVKARGHYLCEPQMVNYLQFVTRDKPDLMDPTTAMMVAAAFESPELRDAANEQLDREVG